MSVALARPCTLGDLVLRHGGALRGAGEAEVSRVATLGEAGEGDLTPLLSAKYVALAGAARARGALVLVDGELAGDARAARVAAWVHPQGSWALAGVLDACAPNDAPPVMGEGCVVEANAVVAPGVVLGKRVVIGAGSVIGRPGFGWAAGPDGHVRAIPQLGGVWIDDDVVIGALCTVDAGTLSPTRIRAGAKLDAHVHVAHNCDVGEGTIIAAQCGFAGSVRIGRAARVGGQVGVADHVTIGDGARIAAKSGVIGDVPAGAVVAGYPAVPRGRWLRALARAYRGIARASDDGTDRDR